MRHIIVLVSPIDKPLVWLVDTVTTPPLGTEARITAGYLLRRLQQGEVLAMPDSKPMPSIGSRCHELRINDEAKNQSWRMIYRLDTDAIVIADWFTKKTQKTPQRVVDACKDRFKEYDRASRGS